MEREDRRLFHCLNRADEDPFAEAGRQNEIENDKKMSWTELVQEPCEKGKAYRRCLGDRPDACVDPTCKC